MNFIHLCCSFGGKEYDPRRLYNLCDRGKPLRGVYELERAQTTLSQKSLAGRVPTLWRYEEVLSVDEQSITA